MTVFEANRKDIGYELINPNNKEQIEHVSLCERIGFETGIDPVELPGVLRFIAQHGNIWLQYVLEERKKSRLDCRIN